MRGAAPNSLSGSIALIFRGICTFETKLNNAQAAGAVGGLVYDNVDQEAPVTMAMGTANLPSEMISYQDGLALKKRSGHPVRGDAPPAGRQVAPARSPPGVPPKL